MYDLVCFYVPHIIEKYKKKVLYILTSLKIEVTFFFASTVIDGFSLFSSTLREKRSI